jgi:hypothetical protein
VKLVDKEKEQGIEKNGGRNSGEQQMVTESLRNESGASNSIEER